MLIHLDYCCWKLLAQLYEIWLYFSFFSGKLYRQFVLNGTVWVPLSNRNLERYSNYKRVRLSGKRFGSSFIFSGDVLRVILLDVQSCIFYQNFWGNSAKILRNFAERKVGSWRRKCMDNPLAMGREYHYLMAIFLFNYFSDGESFLWV